MKEEKVNWNKKDDTNKLTMPITYPNARFEKSHAARPDEDNVEQANYWVDHGSLL